MELARLRCRLLVMPACSRPRWRLHCQPPASATDTSDGTNSEVEQLNLLTGSGSGT